MPVMKDKEAVEAFNSLVSINVGDGAKNLFWTDRWVRGSATMELAPEVFMIVSIQRRSRHTVREAMENDSWVSDVGSDVGPEGLVQCLCILAIVCTVVLFGAV
jgi:hypothetical protein